MILAPEPLKREHEVTVIDNFMFRQNSLLDCWPDPKFSVIRCGARDMTLMGR